MANYQCKKCGTKFEKAESCGCSCSDEKTKCPQCGSTDIENADGLDSMRVYLENAQFSGG